MSIHIENALMNKRVVFLRDLALRGEPGHFLQYKGQMGKIVAISPYGGSVNVVVCPDNSSLPLATVDVGYLQFVKEHTTTQEQVLATLREANQIQRAKHDTVLMELKHLQSKKHEENQTPIKDNTSEIRDDEKGLEQDVP